MAPAQPLPDAVEILDEDVLHHVQRGSELLTQGDAEGAATALARARELRPRDPGVLGLLGQACYRLQRYEDAAEVYQRVVQELPREPSAHVNLGLARLKARQHADAIEAFERALELQPDHERALRYLGLALLEQGDAAAAREWFVRAGARTMIERCDEVIAAAADEAAPDAANAAPRVQELITDHPAAFVIERGVLVTRVAAEVLARAEGLVAVRGAVRLTTVPRQQRGQTTDRSFGEGPDRMLRATGTGALVHALRGRRPTRLVVDAARTATVREPLLLAFDGALAYENGRVSARPGVDLDMVQLRGRGEAVLVAERSIVAIPVTPAAPVRVRLAAFAGWLGPVAPRLGTLVEGLTVAPGAEAETAIVELSGHGTALVEGAE